MTELLTLGPVDLRGEAHDVRAVLAQPKRLALLIYLAMAAPRHFQRRDTLLALFWPESDEKRARAALRQALRYLRQALGKGVLINRGTEEVGIAEGTLYCDAAAFEELLRVGDSVGALSLYRGDLLPGFFVSDAPAFERWLEKERARLREAAADAAWNAAASAEAEGNPADAKDWARWAMERSPADELALRRLISTLSRLGDRAAALKAFETSAQQMHADYGVAPSPETIALVASIRAHEAAAISPAASPPAASPPAVSSGRAHGEGSGRASSAASVEAHDPRRVLVAVFENRTGDPDLDPVGTMAADWIAQGLSRIDGLRVIPLTAAIASSRYAHRVAGSEDPADRTRVMAAETGVGTIVSGAYYADAETLRFSTLITDATHGEILLALGPVRAPVETPLPAIETLQRQVLVGLAPLLDTRIAHVRVARRPPTYEAYRAYVEGLERFIRGAWRDALFHFQRSAASDVGYKLPLVVSAVAYWNLGELAEAEAVVREVDRSCEGLGPFERAVLDMVQAWLRGDWGAAREACLRQARLAPGSIAHFQVAEEARRLNRPREALDVLSQIEPERGEMRGWIFYWIELTHAHHRLGRHRQELELAQQARARYPDEPAALLLEVRALAALGRVEDVYRRLDERTATPHRAPPGPAALMREAALELRAHGHTAPAQELFERSLDWYLNRPLQEQPAPLHRRDLARAYYYAGRWEEARALFADIGAGGEGSSVAFHHGHLQGYLDRGYLGVLTIRLRDREAEERIERELTTLPQAYLFGSNTYWRAAMAALKGEKARAVSLLRQAFAEGLPHEMFIHTDIHFETLRNHRPYLELMLPRG